MTRSERLVRAEALAKEQLERQRTRLSKVKSQQREEERKALAKRRMLIGTLAEECGLFGLDDSTLAQLFSLLASLAAAPDPVGLLASVLASPDSLDAQSVDGTAHAPQTAHGVPPGGGIGI